MDWVTTSTILEALHDSDDRGAWMKLVQRFQRPIVSFALRVGVQPTEAEDVAQETLMAFAENYRQGKYDRRKGRLSHWLFGIAYRQIQRERRRHARRAKHVSAVPGGSSFWSDVPAEQQASSLWDTEWENALLQSCIEQARQEFTAQTFRSFELSVQNGCSAADVANQLEVPIKTVYNAKHRVIQRIRELRALMEETA